MWNRFTGLVGIIVCLFGFLGALVLGSFAQRLMLAHLLLGGLLLVIWAVQGGLTNMGEASQALMGRTARFSANIVLFSAVFVGLLAVCNWFAHRYNQRLDLTEEQVYSLSDQSVQVVKGLKSPLRIVGFELEMGESDATRELLNRYASHNPAMLRVELVNPRSKPGLVERYGMKQGNQLYLEFGEPAKEGSVADPAAVSRINEVTEEAITNAILKLTRGAARNIYYVTGHGEPDITSTAPNGFKKLVEAISDEHMTVEPMLLAQKGSVPDNAAAVLLVSPKKPLLTEEKEALVKYVEGGGRLVMMHDPQTTDDIRELGARFGIEVGQNVVLDTVQRLFAAPAVGAQPLVQTYGNHPITRGMTEAQPTVYNLASSVRTTGKSEGGVSYTELAKSGPAAWGETDLGRLFADEPAAELSDQDLRGPVALAVAYEKTQKSEGAKPESEAAKDQPSFEQASRVVVFGDSDFVANANLHVLANRDLALNAINWSVGEDGGLVIRPRSIRESSAPMMRETFLIILTSSFLVPEFILIFGLFVWWRRRALSFA